MGPCEVWTHVRSGRYTVNTPCGQDDYFLDQMKEYRQDTTGPRITLAYYEPTVLPEDDTWKVDKILKHRLKNGRLEWQVLWRGHSKPTWEKAEHFL